MPPIPTLSKEKSRPSTPSGSGAKGPKGAGNKLTPKARHTLSELSQNNSSLIDKEDAMRGILGNIEGEKTLRYTPELNNYLKKTKNNIKEHIKSKLSDSLSHLEIVGWSKNGTIQATFYDNLFTSDLNVKTLTLRGRGDWSTCHCPRTNNKCGELIDTITQETTTNLEHLNIFRTFKISSCCLLDLIARSPNLKTLRFYGALTEETHYDNFSQVRFLSDLEAVYWPWCNVKKNKPTLRALIKKNSNITTLYTTSDIVCDFINSDLLPDLKYLSLIMNEKWVVGPSKTKVLKRYNRNINALRRAVKIEALEVRTFDVNYQLSLDEKGDPDTHDLIRNNFETYKIQFWENIRDLPKLTYLAIYGAWELEDATREMSKHGLQIEYFRTNLIPNSILSNLDETDNTTKALVLSMSDAAKHLAKLAKLKSLHFTCHDNLSNIDEQTASAMRELSDLIWKFEIKSAFTSEVEELLTNILRRGNQNSRSYRIRLMIEPEDINYSNLYAETIEKFQSTKSLKESLIEFAQSHVRVRFGKSAFKTYRVWGIEQAGDGRGREAFDQLVTAWNFYEKIFKPVDRFI